MLIIKPGFFSGEIAPRWERRCGQARGFDADASGFIDQGEIVEQRGDAEVDVGAAGRDGPVVHGLFGAGAEPVESLAELAELAGVEVGVSLARGERLGCGCRGVSVWVALDGSFVCGWCRCTGRSRRRRIRTLSPRAFLLIARSRGCDGARSATACGRRGDRARLVERAFDDPDGAARRARRG